MVHLIIIWRYPQLREGDLDPDAHFEVRSSDSIKHVTKQS